MSAKVVSLNGDELPQNGVAEGCVACLRKWLEQAERGEIHSVALALVRSDATQTVMISDWFIAPGDAHALFSSIGYLQRDMHVARGALEPEPGTVA